MEKKQKKEHTFKDLIELLLPKAWIILIVSVLCASGLFVYSYTKVDTYTSSALFLVEPKRNSDKSAPTIYDPEIAIDQINNYFYATTMGDDFALTVQNAAKEKGVDVTAEQFRSMLAFVKSDDPIFYVKITHTDPYIAYMVAQTTVECLIELVASIEDDSGLLNLISSPKLPDPANPNSKNEVRNTIIGFLIGFIISAGLILVFALFDVTIRDKEKIEDYFDIPVLGVIPYQEIVKSTEGCGYGGGN